MNAALKFILFISCALFLVPKSHAATIDAALNQHHQVFKISHPDYTISPITGMTRQHWKDAALYVLKGAFSYIHSLDDPMKFPKLPGKSYPRNASQIPTEKLEGICRTLFYATPLLKDNPDLVINHIKVADYYRHQLGLLVDSTSLTFIRHRLKNGGPNQILVELGALSISLFAIPDILWKPLPSSQRNALAATMLSYGDGPTVPSNWKFFNIFVLSFLKSQGYTVNETLLKEYLQKSLNDYRGEGWYNDNPAYDYYSMWGFQMYGILWSEYFGKKYYPDFARQFKNNFKEVKHYYPYMFSKSGKMIMWGRSISYRYAAVAPFEMMGFENDSTTNYGWMRRIASGTVLQFLQNPMFMKDSIPTLGFYGPFEPAVQSYSCRGSVFWSGKAFLGLLVPADNPFWTAKENDGPWEFKFKKNHVYSKFSNHTNILITDYPNIGASEVRAWCNVPVIGASEPFRGSENYNRLSYNSAFPWQADGNNGEVSMNYVVKNIDNKWEALRLYTFRNFKDGVYYRDAVLETNKKIQFKLADIPLPNGILRIDKVRCDDPALKMIQLRLGHYALPEMQVPISELTSKIGKFQVHSIDNGKCQLAMIPLEGFKHTEYVHCTGLNAQSHRSTVINAFDTFIPGNKKYKFYITLELWKNAGKNWTNSEIEVVKQIKIDQNGKSVKLILYDGRKINLSF